MVMCQLTEFRNVLSNCFLQSLVDNELLFFEKSSIFEANFRTGWN